MMGSAAMNLSYASCGRVDGYFQKGIKCWDICAGVIIYREAGGYVTDYEGNESFDLYKGEIIAVPSKEFAKEVINTIKS